MKKTIAIGIMLLVSVRGHNQGTALKEQSQFTTSSKLVNPEKNTPFPYGHAIKELATDKLGHLWFTSTEGLYMYDGNAFRNYKEVEGLSLVGAVDLVQDKDGNIWVGAKGGLVKVSIEGTTPKLAGYAKPTTTARNSSGIWTSEPPGNDFVHNIYIGMDGTAWFGSGYKLYYLDVTTKKIIETAFGGFQYDKRKKAGRGNIDDFGFQGMQEDAEGNFLVAEAACEGEQATYLIHKADKYNPCFTLKCNHNLSNAKEKDQHKNNLEKIFHLVKVKGTDKSVAFYSSFKMRSGEIYYAGQGLNKLVNGQFVSVMSSTELDKDIITKLFQDSKGNLWFGTAEGMNFEGKGVYFYNTTTHQLQNFDKADGLLSGLPFSNNVVTCIAEDGNGKIWVAGDAGLSFFAKYPEKGKRPVIKTLEKADGMDESHIYSIVSDKTGNIWFGTWNLGLFGIKADKLNKYTE